MKKIGLIDYYLDEAHANQYPKWIEEETNGEMKVTCAYGKIDSPSGVSNASWCLSKGIQHGTTIDEIVEESDYLIILAPDHPEIHRELSAIPLRSGKPTYIDKTFAPDRNTALHLFELAQKHGTPLYSSSALRFATEYATTDRNGIELIHSSGPGKFTNYAIHQVEPIISMMGIGIKRLMHIGTPKFPALILDFADGRQAIMQHYGWECPFSMILNYTSGNSKMLKPESDYFNLFIKNLISFFQTGKSTVQSSETVAIVTILEYSLKAINNPFQWVLLPNE